MILDTFARREARLSSSVPRLDWAGADLSEPTGLSKEMRSNDYRIYFGSPTRRVVAFRYISGDVVITDISSEIGY
jgi:hypothetical protein